MLGEFSTKHPKSGQNELEIFEFKDFRSENMHQMVLRKSGLGRKYPAYTRRNFYKDLHKIQS